MITRIVDGSVLYPKAGTVSNWLTATGAYVKNGDCHLKVEVDCKCGKAAYVAAQQELYGEFARIA